MQVDIFFNGSKFLHNSTYFSESLLKRINDFHQYDFVKKRFEGMLDEVELIKELCIKGEIENKHGYHLTLETEFALQLQFLDVINCSCLKPLSKLGEALKELMIDEYQLVLRKRSWSETDKLTLWFEVLDYADSYEFIESFMKGKSHKKQNRF